MMCTGQFQDFYDLIQFIKCTCFRGLIHCVLVQYLSGTLDRDPRENLLKVEPFFTE